MIWKVLELLPGRSGWYTKILGPVLEENGKLYLSIGATSPVAKMIADNSPGFASTEVIPFDGVGKSATDERRATVPEFSFGVRKMDMVLTFRNLHNFDAAEGRGEPECKAAFEALKKRRPIRGGGSHEETHAAGEARRSGDALTLIQVIKEVEAAGFKFVDYSDLHYKPDDELRYEVGRESVTGKYGPVYAAVRKTLSTFRRNL